MNRIAEQIKLLREKRHFDQAQLATILGTSRLAIDRWERGDTAPSPEQTKKLNALIEGTEQVHASVGFASKGSTRRALKSSQRDLFKPSFSVSVLKEPGKPVFKRLKHGQFVGCTEAKLSEMLNEHQRTAITPQRPAHGATSAGKNTYTYDAHTYHTKVPPQGILEFLRYYLPEGGLILDPFSGSGMTGVAARLAGTDVILNDLSPAACFISHNFTESLDVDEFAEAFRRVTSALRKLRRQLYTTTCRECARDTEILYTVWSYRVLCRWCSSDFLLWDHCRRYGSSVREHKILSEFDCPKCHQIIKKSTLKRTVVEPVMLGYKCCRSVQVEHSLSGDDLRVVRDIAQNPPVAKGFFPTTELPEGVNLNQPKRHGLNRIDQFYSPRNLAALSCLWREIHKISDTNLASAIAFVFTSLYQRVSKLSEFRFWGGSGNTAHFNVPFIFNEANVFVTFERKAASVLDHLETTASGFSGNKAVVCGSATDLSYLPDESVDFIFTDPPFGANINYSEMNILWESWLEEFTDPTEEAIVNRVQNKDVDTYHQLMRRSLSECFRVLRPNHWMLLVFMNSSAKVWDALRRAVNEAGFIPEKIDIFDKQHGTFKQFVSENTAGCDLVLHCRKPLGGKKPNQASQSVSLDESIKTFLHTRSGAIPKTVYLHVSRKSELDLRMLYSEWLAFALLRGHDPTDFATFRSRTSSLLVP